MTFKVQRCVKLETRAHTRTYITIHNIQRERVIVVISCIAAQGGAVPKRHVVGDDNTNNNNNNKGRMVWIRLHTDNTVQSRRLD